MRQNTNRREPAGTHSPRRLGLERLEERTLLADCAGMPVADVAVLLQQKTISAATVITHGFQLFDSGGDSLDSLARSVLARADAENGPDESAWLLDYDVVECESGPVGRFDTVQSLLPVAGTAARGEAVLLFDWARESNESTSGWGEAAADALFSLLLELGFARPGSTQPLHLIGHSFGTAITSEAVERLVSFGIEVDQVTYLDPHDFDQTGLPFDGSQRLFDLGRPEGYGATAWQGVSFTDVYYQTDAFLPIPDGRAIPGAVNFLVNDQVNSFNPHSEIWEEFYRGTIASAASTTGYAYSRLGGRARPILRESSSQPFRFHSVPASAQNLANNPTVHTDRGRTLSQDEVNFAQWQPHWNALRITNGDFQQPGDSAARLPGWTDHGGGGNGPAVCSGNTCYLELDTTQSTRTHNRFFVPAGAAALVFDWKRIEASTDDQLEVRLGNQVLATLPIDAVDATFAAQFVAIPAAIRGGVHILTLELVAGGPAIDSRVQIDNLRLGAWQNPTDPTDVTADFVLAPNDVLVIINEINEPRVSGADGTLPPAPPANFGPPHYDVSGDGFVVSRDALIVINRINAQVGTGEAGEGEGAHGIRLGHNVVAANARDLPPIEPDGDRSSDRSLARDVRCGGVVPKPVQSRLVRPALLAEFSREWDAPEIDPFGCPIQLDISSESALFPDREADSRHRS